MAFSLHAENTRSYRWRFPRVEKKAKKTRLIDGRVMNAYKPGLSTGLMRFAHEKRVKKRQRST